MYYPAGVSTEEGGRLFSAMTSTGCVGVWTSRVGGISRELLLGALLTALELMVKVKGKKVTAVFLGNY